MDYANNIDQATSDHVRSGQGDTSAADLRAVFAEVAAAVRFLQNLTAGAAILVAAGAPASGLGKDGDLYISTTTTDVYHQDAGDWGAPLFKMRGADGRTPRLGIDYQNGRTPVLGVDYQNGRDGKSAYELAQQNGFSGTLPQWLASLKPQDGEDGQPGAAGSRARWESYAPTGEAGNVGDTWYYAVSASKLQIYECLGQSGTSGATTWRLRFTSPDPVATTVTTAPTTGGSTNGVTLSSSGDGTKFLADDGRYKTVQAGSSLSADVQAALVGGSAPATASNYYATKADLKFSTFDYCVNLFYTTDATDYFADKSTITKIIVVEGVNAIQIQIGATANYMPLSLPLATPIQIPAGTLVKWHVASYLNGANSGTLYVAGSLS